MNNLEQSSIEQFNSWADTHDKKNWQDFFSNNGILKYIKPKEGASLLDIGCATGSLLHQLSLKHTDLDLHGLDISPKMVAIAQKKLGSKANIVTSSANTLPFKENTFNYVTCATSFHHYSEPQKALDEMYRVLKPNGTLILLDPFRNGLVRKIICKTLDIIFIERDTNIFTKEQIKSMFKVSEFKHIEQHTYLFYKLITIGIK